LFPLSVKEKENSKFVYEFAINSRNNESLCGEIGFYYSEKLNENDTISDNDTNGENTIKRLIDDYSLFLGRPSKIAEVTEIAETAENNDINNDINNDKKNNVKKMIHEYNIYIRQNQVM
jgi:hypothetical protein